MSVTFGVSDTTFGLSQSITTNDSVETAEARGGNGKVQYMTAFSKTMEVEEQVVVSGSLPTIGSVDGTNGLVTSVATTAAQGKYKEATVKYQKKDSATQTAYS